jgi:hypothetical protein
VNVQNIKKNNRRKEAMAKLFKIQAYIVDYGDEFCTNKYLEDYLIQCTQHDLSLDHLRVQSIELEEWDDNHPLNRVDCPESEYDKYFKENDKPKRGLRAKTNIIDDKFVDIINDLKNNTQPKISQNNTEEGLK